MTARHGWVTASGGAQLVAAAAPGQVTVDAQARTISGLVVPFGKPGLTSQGRLVFAAGSLSWTDPSRVKLLIEHDQRAVVGFATALEERPEGLWGTFHVPAGPDGDEALAKAGSRLRDGLSVGVQLDEASTVRLRRAQGGAVSASGALREVSSVSVPAFDDARVATVAATTHDLVVSAWSNDTTPERTTPMPCQLCGQVHANGVTSCQPTATVTASTPTPEPTPVPEPAPQPSPSPAPEPAPLATAGAAYQVGGEASVYSFDGEGPSLVSDAFHARIHGNAEAAARLQRFNAQLEDGNAPSVMALAAVAVTSDFPAGLGLTQTGYRPDLLRQAIDARRPIISRLSTINITSAQPFVVPKEGEFTGVADHVEGTAHVPEGTMTGADEVLQPKAVSGAYRVSRELVDASNPALDRVALRAMIRDYRRLTEAKVVAAIIAATGAATGSINTLMELRGVLLDFMGDDDLQADFVVSGKSFFRTLASEADGSGRPMLTATGSAPSVGSPRAGWTGLDVDGVELVKSSQVATGEALVVEADAVLWAESRVQTFRFDEVEGPGVIKLALWAYCGAAVLDNAGVDRLASA